MNSKPLKTAPDFQQQQAGFTAYIKAPLHHPMPADVKPERMAMYAELIFNNVESFLSNTFPVLKKILANAQWRQLVRDFFSQHSSKTPYFSDIPQEFLAYCQDERNNPDDYPFLLELAHYEWVEMAVAIAQDELVINQDVDDLLNKHMRLSPLAWLLAYQYPVQHISPDFLPTKVPVQPTFLVVYRNQADDVKFIAINPITYRLLTLIQEKPGLVAVDYLQQIAAESGHVNTEILMAGGLQILKAFAEKNIITLVS
jgi:hypothetical protein